MTSDGDRYATPLSRDSNVLIYSTFEIEKRELYCVKLSFKYQPAMTSWFPIATSVVNYDYLFEQNKRNQHGKSYNNNQKLLFDKLQNKIVSTIIYLPN